MIVSLRKMFGRIHECSFFWVWLNISETSFKRNQKVFSGTFAGWIAEGVFKGVPVEKSGEILAKTKC